MNAPRNPYEPPPENDNSLKRKASFGSFVAGCLAFCGVSFVTWISTLLFFFGDSTEIWPALISILPALFSGTFAFYAINRDSVPMLLRVSIVFSSCMVVLLFLVFFSAADRRNVSFTPDGPKPSPGHWALLAFATMSFFSASTSVICHHNSTAKFRTLSILLTAFSFLYVGWWLASYFAFIR